MKYSFFIILLICTTLTSSCSRIKLTFAQLKPKAVQIPTANLVTISSEGLVEQQLQFTSPPGEDLGTFVDYTFSCAFKTEVGQVSSACSQYGDESPSIDDLNEKLLWTISSNTPKGIYTFTVQKNYSNASLSLTFDLKIDIRAPFISKWQLNPDKVLNFKLNNNYTYNFIVNWGDGSATEHITTAGTVSHTYTHGETQATITIHGDLPAFAIDVIDPNNRNALIQLVADTYGMTFADVQSLLAIYTTAEIYNLLVSGGASLTPSPFNSKLLEITNLGDLHWQNLDYAFANQSLLTKVSGGNLTNVTSMKSTFLAAGYSMPTNSPVEFNTTTWNLINVVSIEGLFQVVQFAPTSNLSGMKFSNKLLNISNFLSLAKGDLSTATDWNFSNVTDMSKAFSSARLSNLNTTGWNTQNVTDFSSTFYGFECTSCNFEGVQITSKTKKTTSMFKGYNGPSEINLGVSSMIEVEDSFEMFQFLDFSFLPDTSWINVANKNKNISYMFSNVTDLALDTSSWNTSNVENFEALFKNVDMNQVDTSGIVVTAKATNTVDMFTKTINLTLNTNSPGKVWNTSSVINMSYMVGNGRCKTISSCDFSRIIPSVNTTNMNGTFACDSYVSDNSNFPPVDTTSWNTTKVKNFEDLFYARDMAGSDLSGLNVTSEAETLKRMFIAAKNLQFDTTGWNISNVTDISQIFQDTDVTNVNFSGFNPSSALKKADSAFYKAGAPTLDTTLWNISGLESASSIFYDVNLINVDLRGFNPGPAMQSLYYAFFRISNGTINTENWNLSNTVNVDYLFGANENSVFTLKDINLAALPNTTDLFWGPSNGSNIYIEGTTTDFSGDLTGGFWPRIWCPNWSGTTFGGVTCQK